MGKWLRITVVILSCTNIISCTSNAGERDEISLEQTWALIEKWLSTPTEKFKAAIERSAPHYSTIFPSDLSLELGIVGLLVVDSKVCAIRFSDASSVNGVKSVNLEIATFLNGKNSPSSVHIERLHVGKLWGFSHLGYQSGNTSFSCGDFFKLGWEFPSMVNIWEPNARFTVTEFKEIKDVNLVIQQTWYDVVSMRDREPIRIGELRMQ